MFLQRFYLRMGSSFNHQREIKRRRIKRMSNAEIIFQLKIYLSNIN